MRITLQLSFLLTALGSLATTANAQEVWVVDHAGGPGSDFASVDLAVGTASSGDIILIRDGAYFNDGFFGSPIFEVDGKSLVFIADAGAEVDLFIASVFPPTITGLNVSNLSANQSVAIRGINVNGVVGINNLGTLWIEDNSAETIDYEGNKVRLVDCATTVINRCSLVGPSSIFGFGAPSIEATRSGLHLFDTALEGGIGGVVAGGGGTLIFNPAALIADSFLYASGGQIANCSFQGIPCPDITLTGTSAEAILLDTPGTLDVQGGTASTLPGVARSFEMNSPVREGEILAISFGGEPGDIAILNLSLKPTGIFFPQLAGSALLDFPLFLVRVLGTVPASGTLTKNITLNELGAGVEGVVFYAQGSFANQSGIFVGGGSVVVLLDDSL